jgi:hypothetical protein
MRGTLKDFFALLLRDATEDAKGFALPCLAFELLQAVEYLLFRFIPNAAGVIQHKFGVGRFVDLAVTLLDQGAHDFFRIMRIHLTPEGLNVESFHVAHDLAMQQAHEPADSKQRGQKTTKAVQTILQTLVISFLCHHSQHNA